MDVMGLTPMYHSARSAKLSEAWNDTISSESATLALLSFALRTAAFPVSGHLIRRGGRRRVLA